MDPKGGRYFADTDGMHLIRCNLHPYPTINLLYYQGTVISEPPDAQKPQNNSEYDLTSIIATTRKLLDMPDTPLTDRDAWVSAAVLKVVFSALCIR